MFSRIAHLSKVARGMPWQLVATRGLQKLGFQSSWMRRVDFLCTPDTVRPTKVVEIVLSSLRQVGLCPVALASALPGAAILEIGCGRHAGFAPFAIGLGARSYIGIDPALDRELLMLPDIKRRYLVPSLHAARNLAERLPEFQHLPFVLQGTNAVDELLARCRFIQGGIGDWENGQEKADICVSISCLEHIRDFSEAARVMASVSHSGTAHIHVVNFSSHLSKQLPFHQLYEMPYDDFGKRWQYSVNGLRVSDMLNAFGDAGLPLRSLPLDIRPDVLPAYIDPSWKDRYCREELALRTAVLTSL